MNGNEDRWWLIKKRWITDMHAQDSETGPNLPYMEASLCYADDQGQSLFKYPRDVMSHIRLTLETAFTG
jgi:hypothetical protein